MVEPPRLYEELEEQAPDELGQAFVDPSHQPLAGFEIEAAEAQIVRLDQLGQLGGQHGKFLRRLQDDHDQEEMDRAKAQRLSKYPNLRKRRGEALAMAVRDNAQLVRSKVGFAKRHVFIRSEHGVWDATADTVGRYHSRLEIVTQPLSAHAWTSTQAQADLATLVRFCKAVKEVRAGAMVPLRELIVGIPGLRLLEPQAWIIGEDCRFDFQMTRQIPLEVHYPDDGDRKCGMSARGLEHMRRTFGTFINPRFSGNPKEAFGELPKTPLDLLIDLKKRIRKEDLDTWVEEVAALTGLKRHLDENPIAPMANKAGRGMSLQVPEFTWRDVLTALARKQGDLLEDWSHSGFGDEDFGYGALRNAKLLKGHGIFENRKPGGSGKGIAERIAYLLGEWKAQLQQPQQVSPSNSVPETSPPPTSDRADAPSSSARLSHTETPTHSDST